MLSLSRDAERPDWLESTATRMSRQAKTLTQYELNATRIVESCATLLLVRLIESRLTVETGPQRGELVGQQHGFAGQDGDVPVPG